ncbi:2Fe-2S iron-sulfur cluster-binding protein [Aquamicrobium sp. LC103]|uniref:2Fe-2S iron-sulfur cluster-binding protein n=1 Tax=Aquamicrobium sp. LC103 TaxID=1120658 RepID=UPI0009E19971|nr:2Fe-2S iron-sulfur cluster-binding protein [Aquamicrobium sp. LC103]TKT74478.1 (2Fe-2S)-binding protein [Aquamicrobium sp. LC103]
MADINADAAASVVVRFRLANGTTVEASGACGASVMETAISGSVPGILAECGGALSCATCHVYVDEEWLDRFGPMDPFEDEMLEGTASPRQRGSRLSCQIRLSPELSGIVLTIPPTQY